MLCDKSKGSLNWRPFYKEKYKGDNLEGDEVVNRWEQVETTTRAKALDYRKKGYWHWEYFSILVPESNVVGRSKGFRTQKTRTANHWEGTGF